MLKKGQLLWKIICSKALKKAFVGNFCLKIDFKQKQECPKVVNHW